MTAQETIQVNQIIEMLKMQEQLRSQLREKDDEWRDETTAQIKSLQEKIGTIPSEIALAIEKCREGREYLTKDAVTQAKEREVEKRVLHRLSVRVRYVIGALSGLVAILSGLLAYFR